MKEVFLATLSPMLVMVLCIFIGIVLRKYKILPENSGSVLSKLETWVLMPALVINTFRRYCTLQTISSQYINILVSAGVLAVGICFAVVLCRFFSKDDYEKKIYRYALSFANFGFMGNAIVPAILGEEYLYPYMIFTLPLNIAVYTWGFFSLIPKGEDGGKWWKQLLNPIFIAIVIGATLGLSGANNYVPAVISDTLDSCAACMAPLAMILTGFIIGGYDIKSLISNKKVYIATFLRLVVLPLIFIGGLLLLGIPKNTLIFAFFAFGTPLGLNTVIIPAAYGGNTTTGASMAMLSHTLCAITIPLIYSFIVMIA